MSVFPYTCHECVFTSQKHFVIFTVGYVPASMSHMSLVMFSRAPPEGSGLQSLAKVKETFCSFMWPTSFHTEHSSSSASLWCLKSSVRWAWHALKCFLPYFDTSCCFTVGRSNVEERWKDLEVRSVLVSSVSTRLVDVMLAGVCVCSRLCCQFAAEAGSSFSGWDVIINTAAVKLDAQVTAI